MTDAPESNDGPPPVPPPRFQFSLASLFLVTFLASLLALAFGGMFRAETVEFDYKPRFIVVVLVAPSALVVLFGTLHLIFRRPKKKRRHKW